MPTTAVVTPGSDLERKQWINENMVQAASKSLWTPITSLDNRGSLNSVVVQKTDLKASEGHTVVFDYTGNIAGKLKKNKETAYGTGLTKLQFSSKISIDRYRISVYNGDKFDATNTGHLELTEHSDSMSKLADLFVRTKDQIICDVVQGIAGQTPTHIIDLGTTFTFNDLTDIEVTLKTSNGYDTGSIRRPPEPYTLSNGEPCWVMMMDAKMMSILRKDTSGWQAVMQNADIRGNDNRLIKGVAGKIGSLLLVEVPQFFGSSDQVVAPIAFNESSVEIAGLRQYDGADPATALWTGQSGFSYSSSNLHSRAVILGKGAVQLAFGKMPEYKLQFSQDFAIDSESCLEFWMNSQKTKLTAEQEDYAAAKIAAIDYGVVAVDLEVQ